MCVCVCVCVCVRVCAYVCVYVCVCISCINFHVHRIYCLSCMCLMLCQLHEKKEALIHQKLAGQVLSARLQETERKLQSMTEADGDVFHN